MHTKAGLIKNLADMGVRPDGTLLVHSSMKSVGEVEGRADTVLDALMEYMKDGLLVLPIHTWSSVNTQNPVMDVSTSPACVGILPNLFFRREGVIRSLHPTHSVAAYGRDAESYTSGEQFSETPCARQGCWGRLVDRGAQILFIGCDLTHNTLLHGTEEWNDIPGRLEAVPETFTVIDRCGRKWPVRQYRHNGSHPSNNYGKMEPVFLERGVISYGVFGSAHCVLGDAAGMNAVTAEYLKMNPGLFSDAEPVK